MEASIGTLDFRQIKTALSGPLNDTIAARLALSYTDREGTLFNAATGADINEQNNLGIRGQLLWQASDALNVTMALDWSRQNKGCCGTVFVGTGATQRPLDRQFAALAAAQGYQVPSARTRSIGLPTSMRR